MKQMHTPKQLRDENSHERFVLHLESYGRSVQSISRAVGQSIREPAGQSVSSQSGQAVSKSDSRSVGLPVFEIYEEPASPNKKACLRYVVERSRQMWGHV